MYLGAVVVLAIVLGGLALLASIKVMSSFAWFFSWLRGTFGLFLLALAVFVVLAAINLSDFDGLLEEKPIASISFDKLGEQHYRANVNYYIDKEPATYEIYGDQWQIDARIVRWTGVIAAVGAQNIMRLQLIAPAARIFTPNALIKAIVKVKIFKVFKRISGC